MASRSNLFLAPGEGDLPELKARKWQLQAGANGDGKPADALRVLKGEVR
jgi:hypothetical protein